MRWASVEGQETGFEFLILIFERWVGRDGLGWERGRLVRDVRESNAGLRVAFVGQRMGSRLEVSLFLKSLFADLLMSRNGVFLWLTFFFFFLVRSPHASTMEFVHQVGAIRFREAE